MTALISRNAMPKTECQLFRLIGELRNDIYRHVLSIDDPGATEVSLCSKDL